MNLFIQIRDHIKEYERKTGYRPNVVCLGRIEHQAFEACLKENGFKKIPGIIIERVDADRHLSLGMSFEVSNER